MPPLTTLVGQTRTTSFADSLQAPTGNYQLLIAPYPEAANSVTFTEAHDYTKNLIDSPFTIAGSTEMTERTRGDGVIYSVPGNTTYEDQEITLDLTSGNPKLQTLHDHDASNVDAPRKGIPLAAARLHPDGYWIEFDVVVASIVAQGDPAEPFGYIVTLSIRDPKRHQSDEELP